MHSLFSGPFFEYILGREPLRSAEYLTCGSSAMLFQCEGKLYRLTTDGCGHNFLSQQSANGNPAVVQIIEDFGPVAPNDAYPQEEYYWLAQVEWLEPIDPASLAGKNLQSLFDTLHDDGAVLPEERQPFVDACRQALTTHPEFKPLLETIIRAAYFLDEGEGLIDVNLSNVMLRPLTGELVWSDPIHDSVMTLTSTQSSQMESVRRLAGHLKA
ncbi:hypothetical protein [Halopseudomonas aestusnigri]|uniref:hypothetical protein n=1 Tax=Halopseudomonas aestusnigri TaxID=857252 RepID=UPI0028C3274A|nr:hypothetical protein YSKK_33730 [Halopseudomonas aestusnigri]